MTDQRSSQSSMSWWQRIRTSIWRVDWTATDDRSRLRLATSDLILHLHPPRIPVQALRLTYTYGLGGLSILLFLMLVGSGGLLLFRYDPSLDGSYTSIIALQNDIRFGQLIRNLHHWGGNLLLIVVLLHMLRVFFTAAFRRPREFNWLLGLGLLLLVMLSNFTGYLLPGDQLSYWAVTVMSGLVAEIPLVGAALHDALVGGSAVGDLTVRNFYGLHVVIIPVGVFITTSFHIWRVRKDRITVPRDIADAVIDPPVSPPESVKYVTSVPHLISIEVVYALTVIALLLGWSAVVNAPLGEPANPASPPDPAKAAWYFLGIQELLLHFHPIIAGIVIPLLMMIGLAWVPYARSDANRDDTGIWFRSRLGRRLARDSFLIGAGATVCVVLLDNSVDLRLPSLNLPPLIGNGILPLAFLMGLVMVYTRWIRHRGASFEETRLALFVLFLSVFIVLTVIGNFFRGPGWELIPK